MNVSEFNIIETCKSSLFDEVRSCVDMVIKTLTGGDANPWVAVRCGKTFANFFSKSKYYSEEINIGYMAFPHPGRPFPMLYPVRYSAALSANMIIVEIPAWDRRGIVIIKQ